MAVTGSDCNKYVGSLDFFEGRTVFEMP